MKLKKNLNIEEVDGRFVAIGNSDKTFNGIVYVNRTGKYILELLQNEISREEIIQKITEKYQVNCQKASDDLDKFLKPLIPVDLIEFGVDKK